MEEETTSTLNYKQAIIVKFTVSSGMKGEAVHTIQEETQDGMRGLADKMAAYRRIAVFHMESQLKYTHTWSDYIWLTLNLKENLAVPHREEAGSAPFPKENRQLPNRELKS